MQVGFLFSEKREVPISERFRFKFNHFVSELHVKFNYPDLDLTLMNTQTVPVRADRKEEIAEERTKNRDKVGKI